MSILRGVRCSAVRLSGLPGDMPVAAAHTVKHNRLAAPARRLRFCPEIEPNRLPSIAALRLEPEAGSGLVTAVHHAILATAVACDAVHDAVFVPLGFLLHLRVARVVEYGSEIVLR